MTSSFVPPTSPPPAIEVVVDVGAVAIPTLFVHNREDACTTSPFARAEMITCPVFVCNAERDDISTSAPRLFEALTGEKEYVLFRAAEGAGDHCEAGARTLYHALSFGWLDRVLRPG